MAVWGACARARRFPRGRRLVWAGLGVGGADVALDAGLVRALSGLGEVLLSDRLLDHLDGLGLLLALGGDGGGGGARGEGGMREPGILRSASLTFRSNRRREAPTAEALDLHAARERLEGVRGGARGVSVRATRPNVSICGSKRGSRQRTCHEGIGRRGLGCTDIPGCSNESEKGGAHLVGEGHAVYRVRMSHGTHRG